MLGFVIISTATIAFAIWYFLIKPHSYWKNLGIVQSKPWILFGDSGHSILRRCGLYDFISMMYYLHPESRYSGIYQFYRPVLLIRDPDLIKQVTVKDFEHFTDHPPFIDPDADPLWSSAVFSLKGERWKEMRVTLSPTFTSSKIKSIYNLMLETSENFVKYFLEKDEDVVEFEMKDTYSRFTNDIIATTAFGLKVNSLKEQKNVFYEMGNRLTQFRGISITLRFVAHMLSPKLAKYFGVPFLDRKASNYFYKVIDETIKAREEQNVVRPDMINLLLEARKETKSPHNGLGDVAKTRTVKISNGEITSQAMIFFFAGFDTISTAMCFGSYELAINKDVQDRLREEIRHTQKDGKVTYDDLMKMTYMDMVISEILRKWPPIPNVDRVCTKPFTIEPINENEKPIRFSVNQQIFIPVYGLHRDPKYFPNPEKFDPERFSEENKHNILPYTYMPFGAGPRICIGNRFALVEVKALFFNILLNFEIVPTKKTTIPLVLSKDFNLIPEGGFWLGLKRIRN